MMYRCRTGSIWGGYGKQADGSNPDAAFDVIIANMCGQTGYNPKTAHDGGFWTSAREGRKGQPQELWLAFNSMMVAHPDSSNWMYWVNPLRTETFPAFIHSETITGEENWFGLYDLRGLYPLLWADRAAKHVANLNERFKVRIEGVFADSICWDWGWPAAKPEGWRVENYRDEQVRFCWLARMLLAGQGLKFGANIAALPDYRAWPEILEHVDLAYKEHVRIDSVPEPEIFNPDRNYVMAVGVEGETAQEKQILVHAYSDMLRTWDVLI